jgi:hypothetical protein
MKRVEITDCLGRKRSPDRLFEDGSWNCPFCYAAVVAGSIEHAELRCPNPACVARGDYPADRARAELEAAAKRERELADWKATQHWAREYAAEQRSAEAARLDNVRLVAVARGACVNCAHESARYGRTPKYTKHRGVCPKGRNKKLARA